MFFTKKAFTLIEILIVTAIIGLLVTLAIPAFSRAQLETQRRIIQNNLMQINKAAIQYYMDNPSLTFDAEIKYDDLVTLGYVGRIQPIIGENYSAVAANRDTGVANSEFIVFAAVGFLPAGHPLRIERGNRPLQAMFDSAAFPSI